MATRPELALVAAYVVRHNRLRAAAGVAVARLWDRSAGLDDRGADGFATAAAQVAGAAQQQAAVNVDGYFAALLGVMAISGSPVGVDVEQVTGAAVRAGVEPVEVYRRAIVTARTAVSKGQPYLDAMRAGRDRASATAETDVALAQRAATVQVVEQQDRIVGFRRVLTGASCALCATASTQRYRRGDLMPIHARCDCGVAPIIGDSDPGRVINRRLVNDLKKASPNGDFARDRHITVDDDGTVRLPDVTVRQHGELGPTLTDAHHDFTGPGDIAA